MRRNKYLNRARSESGSRTRILAIALMQILIVGWQMILGIPLQFLSLQRPRTRIRLHSNAFRASRPGKFLLTILLSCLFTITTSGITLWSISPASAAPLLTIAPLGWNVVGLDSNKVTVGPDQYLSGARVCNVGDVAATNVTATFVKDSGTNFINVLGANTLSIPSLDPGSTSRAPGNTGALPSNCFDFYFNLKVTRDSNAYSTLSNLNTRQQFHIDVTATGLGTIRTPTNRELYVEKLVSQSRNAVDSITGPSTVYVGQTVQYTVQGHTAPGGYEQLVFSPVLPVIFQVLQVSSTYSTPAGSANNSVYADGCGWENNYTNTTYYHNNLTCSNPAIPDGYSGAKVGDNVTTIYTIKVLSAGSGALTNIIYDFSGSSYHYNADVGSGLNSFAITALPPSADLSVTKTDNQTTAIPGTPITYTITAANAGPSSVTGATLTDTVPASILGVSWTCVASSGSSCGAANGTGNTINTTVNLLNGGTATYTVTGTISPAALGNLTNTASIAAPSGTTDPNSANNTGSDPPDTLTPQANLSLTKTSVGNFIAGQNGVYTLTVANAGPSNAGALTVIDTLPAGLSFVSGTGTGWSCSAIAQIVTCTNPSGLVVGATSSITLTVRIGTITATSITNTATVSSTTTDPNVANNTGTALTSIFGVPDLTISKTHTGTFVRGANGSYTIAVSNSGGAATTGAVTVTDTLPAGLTLSGTPSGTGWICTTTSTTAFSCTRSDALNASSSYPTIAIAVTVNQNAADSVTNTATVSGGGESNTGNNSSSAVTAIASNVDLSITKTDNQASTIPNSPISYNITVTNNGPSTVNAVTVTDTVPTAIQNPVFTPSTGSYNSSTGAWTGLNFASGQSITLTLTGTVASTATGTITNTATVAPPAGATDSASGNNTATDNTSIYAVAPTARQIIINEVLYAQTGTSAATNDEFIELYNTSSSSIDLSGWKLADSNLIENSTDSAGSITGSSANPAYTFQDGTVLASGQYVVIWIGSNTSNQQAVGAAFQTWLNQPPKLNNTGDDVWLYDSQLRIVDYIAYGVNNGSSNAINTPPPTALNLWNTTYQAVLANASAGQSISLTPNGVDSNVSACWEPTTSGQANGRCTGYLPTTDTDTIATRVTTVGQNNNGAVSTPPNLVLVKRITAINGVNVTGFVDDPGSTDDNLSTFPTPTSTYLRGAINGGLVKPGDVLEYTIYFLSNGGTPATNVNICDLVPANSTFVSDAFNGLTPEDIGGEPEADRGVALGLSSTSFPTAPTAYLSNVQDGDRAQFFPPGTTSPVSCSGMNRNGAVVINVVTSPSSLPPATATNIPPSSYGFIRFRARVQ